MNITPVDLFEAVMQFFSANEAQLLPPQKQWKCSTANLFELACLGSGEKKIQHELYYFLRCKYQDILLVLPEYTGYISGGNAKNGLISSLKKRSIDIMIFDMNMNPVVAIELKGHCANHGCISKLLKTRSDNEISRGGLDGDYDKRPFIYGRPIPLLQIGLYTEIDSVDYLGVVKGNFPLYPLVNTYFSPGSATKNIREAGVVLNAWGSQDSHADRYQKRSGFKQVATPFWMRPNNVKVTGGVHYFVGLSE